MGLGEALVGNFPGSALRAVVSKPALQQLLQQATSAGSPADAGGRHLSVGASGSMRLSERTLAASRTCAVPVCCWTLAIPETG